MTLAFLHARRHLVVRSIGVFVWSCWPPETFGTSAGWTSASFLGFLTCTLKKWNPRPASGTAFSSVHPILSVYQYAHSVDCKACPITLGKPAHASVAPGVARSAPGENTRNWSIYIYIYIHLSWKRILDEHDEYCLLSEACVHHPHPGAYT